MVIHSIIDKIEKSMKKSVIKKMRMFDFFV